MYIIFGSCSFYASGGANDILNVFGSEFYAIEKAKTYIGKRAVRAEPTEWDKDGVSVPIEWVQVYDVVARKTIYKSEGRPHADIDGIIRVKD